MTQYILIVYVLLSGQSFVYELRGQFTLAGCNALATKVAAQARAKYPANSGITYQCLRMAPA
jgi:hypothetical protein